MFDKPRPRERAGAALRIRSCHRGGDPWFKYRVAVLVVASVLVSITTALAGSRRQCRHPSRERVKERTRIARIPSRYAACSEVSRTLTPFSHLLEPAPKGPCERKARCVIRRPPRRSPRPGSVQRLLSPISTLAIYRLAVRSSERTRCR